MDPVHLLFSTSAHFGHLRSATTFISNLLICPSPVVITLLAPATPDFFTKAEREIAKGTAGAVRTKGSHVRLVGLPTAGVQATEDDSFSAETFGDAYRKLLANESLQCAKSGARISPAGRPAGIVLDLAQHHLYAIVRSVPDPIPIFNYFSGLSPVQTYMSGPKEMGGRDGDLGPVAPGEHSCHELVQVSGVPPLRCTELIPQDFRLMGGMVEQFKLVGDMILNAEKECDGYLCINSLAYEGQEIMDVTAAMISRNGPRPTFNLGAMMPMGYGSERFNETIAQVETGGKRDKVLEFLDSHEKNSVVFVSFGATFPIPPMELVMILLRSLMERNIPFVFAHGSSRISPPEKEAVEKARAEFEPTGQCVFSSWVPQQSVLAHKALSYFVTHGGNNSTAEALCQGVPMIVWPLGGDQPFNAAHLTHTLNVAYHVTSWNAGICAFADTWDPEFNPPGHDASAMKAEIGSILDSLNGVIGVAKRRNAIRIGKALREECTEPTGRATMERERFLSYCRGIRDVQKTRKRVADIAVPDVVGFPGAQQHQLVSPSH